MKGISAVLATVLIVVITVAIIGLAYAWSVNLFELCENGQARELNDNGYWECPLEDPCYECNSVLKKIPTAHLLLIGDYQFNMTYNILDEDKLTSCTFFDYNSIRVSEDYEIIKTYYEEQECVECKIVECLQ